MAKTLDLPRVTNRGAVQEISPVLGDVNAHGLTECPGNQESESPCRFLRIADSHSNPSRTAFLCIADSIPVIADSF